MKKDGLYPRMASGVLRAQSLALRDFANSALCGLRFEVWSFLAAIAGDDPVAEDFVRGLDRIDVDGELELAGILGDKLEAELKIFEAAGAQVADGLAFFERFIG